MAWYCHVAELVVVVTLHLMQGVVEVVPRHLLPELCQSDMISAGLDHGVAVRDPDVEILLVPDDDAWADPSHGPCRLMIVVAAPGHDLVSDGEARL